MIGDDMQGSWHDFCITLSTLTDSKRIQRTYQQISYDSKIHSVKRSRHTH